MAASPQLTDLEGQSLSGRFGPPAVVAPAPAAMAALAQLQDITGQSLNFRVGPIAAVNSRFQCVPDRYRLPDKSLEGGDATAGVHCGLGSAAHAQQATGADASSVS
jgi:hypothetical protein